MGAPGPAGGENGAPQRAEAGGAAAAAAGAAGGEEEEGEDEGEDAFRPLPTLAAKCAAAAAPQAPGLSSSPSALLWAALLRSF